MTIILGIDPGSRLTGYGLIKESRRQLEYLDSGCIRGIGVTFHQRLLSIFQGVIELMVLHQPDEVAIEAVFMHRNPAVALKLGHARGVAMVACAIHQLNIFEYSVREIKEAVVGYGAAQKSQVSHMVVQLLNLSGAPQTDAADALGAAICHAHMRHALLLKNSWTALQQEKR